MSEFKQNEYINAYNKEHYTSSTIRFKKEEIDQITEYSQNLGVSKNKLIKMCVKYCYKNMLDLNDLDVK